MYRSPTGRGDRKRREPHIVTLETSIWLCIRAGYRQPGPLGRVSKNLFLKQFYFRTVLYLQKKHGDGRELPCAYTLFPLLVTWCISMIHLFLLINLYWQIVCGGLSEKWPHQGRHLNTQFPVGGSCLGGGSGDVPWWRKYITGGRLWDFITLDSLQLARSDLRVW